MGPQRWSQTQEGHAETGEIRDSLAEMLQELLDKTGETGQPDKRKTKS